jgi:hypothetical protein
MTSKNISHDTRLIICIFGVAISSLFLMALLQHLGVVFNEPDTAGFSKVLEFFKLDGENTASKVIGVFYLSIQLYLINACILVGEFFKRNNTLKYRLIILISVVGSSFIVMTFTDNKLLYFLFSIYPMFILPLILRFNFRTFFKSIYVAAVYCIIAALSGFINTGSFISQIFYTDILNALVMQVNIIVGLAALYILNRKVVYKNASLLFNSIRSKNRIRKH